MTLTPAGSPYTGTSTIETGVTLKAEPGTKLTIGKLTVKGSLRAEGTASEPVVFTSGSKEPRPGIWQDIVFESGAGESVLDHVEIVYAGSTANSGAIEVNGSSPTITNSTIRESEYYGIKVNGGGPDIGESQIIGCAASAGIIYNSSETFEEVNFHDNLVEECGGSAPVFAQANTHTVATSLGGNTIKDNTGFEGIYYSGGPNEGEIPPDIPNNVVEGTTYSGENEDGITFSGLLKKSSTWENPGVPLTVNNGQFTIPKEITLTLRPGITFEGNAILVKGTLKAEGEASDPVVFKPAGETGYRGNIKFEPGSGESVLNHVEVIRSGSALNSGAVEINGSSPTITNCSILESEYYGIKIPEGGSPEIANNVFNTAGVNYAIYFNAGKENSGAVNIHDNTIALGGGGIDVSVNAAASVNAKTLSGNTVVSTKGQGLIFSGPDIPGDITENTLLANEANDIQVGGTVAHSSTWKDGGTRVLLTGVTIASGVTLKIAPSVFLLSPAMTVKGTLIAEGTSAEPVVLTGRKEEKAGEWGSIKFEPGSGESVLDHVEVGYGGSTSGSGMIEAKGSHPRITNSTIAKSQYYGIKVTESGSPTVEYDRFRNDTNGLSYSGTGKLSARNNDWGCGAGGPKPAGCGASVTSNVNWEPAIKLPELAGHCRGKKNQCGEGADPVSMATGQLDYSHRDLLLTNKGRVPLEFTRSYTSGSEADTGLGLGWAQTGLASASEQASGEVLVVRQDGRQDLFTKTESGYKAPSGVTDKLEKVEGTFKLTTLQNTVYRFDSSGRISSVTDDHGLKTTYAYSSEGRLSTITDPSGQTLTFSYNSSNHITAVKDSTGREVKYGYSAAGDLESVTDALGGVTKYAYDASHRMTSITDPRGNAILKNTYDSQGRIVEQEDGLKDLWKLKYGSGETTVTEPQGGKTTYGFDSQNRIVSEVDQLGHVTATAYSAGNVSEVVQPGGGKWIYGHDAAGNLTSVKDPEGGERKYEYDGQNRLTAYTDARGATWKYEWSKANDLTKITDPEGGETALTYNESGQPLTLTDPGKHKAEFSYDTRGNRLSATDPFGHKTSYEYNTRNYLTAETLPGLKAESFERDALGDMLARTTPEGNKTKYAYDANGLPTQITDPAEDVWKIERNAMERPTLYTDPEAGKTEISYNGDLQQTKVTNRRGKVTTYGYDAANQLTEVDRPEGEDWIYGYDSRGNRSSMIDPRGFETTYEYDALNRMVKASEPLEVSTKYGYDANGDLTSLTDPLSHKTSYAYDKLGRLTEVAQPLEKTTKYGYDAAGNKTSKATAAGTLEYGYDEANRLTSIASGKTTLRSYGYDSANRRTSATDAEGHKIEIGYNGEGLVTSIKDGRGQSIARSFNSRGLLTKQEDGRGTIEYGYDKLGRQTSLTDPQGKALAFAYDPEGDLTEVKRPSGVTTVNVFNEAGRLAETTSKAEGGTVLEALKYTYDAEGNVTSRKDTRAETETTYAYDKLGRLTEFNPPGEGSTAYGYDKAGNRTEAGGVTYEFNALNQLVKASDGTTYGYDKAGRMTSKEGEAGKASYEWDLFDHLAKAEGPSETASYAYDALERLSERKAGGSTQIVHYGDLGDSPTYDANGEGKTTTSYVAGPRGLFEERSAEATSYPLADAHGDITALTGSTGSVESRQSFDPWGAQLSGPTQEMGYLGAYERPADSTTGLIRMGARSYSPGLGSFLTEDPVAGRLGVGASFDRYLYVQDNPLNLYDLNGRETCILVLGTCISPQEIQSAWDRASDFIKHALHSDEGNPLACHKLVASSSGTYFPCLEEENGGSPEEGQEFPRGVPPIDPNGPFPSPGDKLPIPSPQGRPFEPVYPLEL